MKKFFYFSLIIFAANNSCINRNYRSVPNVIYISVEDMMPNWGCYGDSIAYTPKLDAFAKEAVLFEDVHCQVALCTPSRTSILTGIRPSTSGIVKIDDDWQKILPNSVSLPRHFRDNGYYTSVAGKIHDYRCGGMDSAYIKTWDTHGISNNELALKALNDVANQKKPFFLAIRYSQAHEPWTPTSGASGKYSTDQFSADGRSPVYKKNTYDESGIKTLIKNYYGEITDVDSLIGELLVNIKDLGLFDNAVILVGAMDHGFCLGFRKKWGKGNCYDNETRVPFMLRLPGKNHKGKSIDALVELVDIYPTLIDLCGLPNPNQILEGTSLVPLLENTDREWKKAVFTHRAYAVDIIGIKTKDYNLIDFAGDSVKLFDRKNDPLNLHDIAGQNPGVVDKMMKIKKQGWQAAVPW